ncbi:GCN5-related N-acetyltransferase [Chlorobaculum parvum NCIB 8327]|uniref:GCN5-related N-acetyltransferase n=1 Tax=Chlorobaculum parvum (strain DSM 263 / NCIMB 8327) TaxID=517417 RepID=B3QPE5_CHLP8|nr:putative beta-lysine N-acetyltransferase [Chlorobaculum parvum]ACF11798.1 GCN5-related N-acetyltransferase [Chlorobaculum parvum NCIB 8327]
MTTTPDIIETRFGALLQHGPFSRRIYLMKMGDADPRKLPDQLDALAREHGYTKIFAKLPRGSEGEFVANGYRVEASVPGFYRGETEAMFLARYLDPARAESPEVAEIARIVELASSKPAVEPPPLSAEFTLRACTCDDVAEMAEIYREVFPTYPFPIHDPAWLLETMESHIDYFGVEDAQQGGRLVALASSEMDLDGLNVEMTDFATLPEFRGRNLALHLLAEMEEAMREKGMRTAYTIARAVSPGMNITFAKAGYKFSGTLVNNTNISGGIESMNVWYKKLA